MLIEHIAMYADDLEQARDFFVKYFNARPSTREKCSEINSFPSFDGRKPIWK